MRISTLLLLSATLFTTTQLKAQDDLLNMLSDSTSTSGEPVFATFKSSRIINAQTTETVGKHDLDFRVGHRFGNVGKGSGGGVHSFYGLDNSADINIAFEYGVTDKFTVGISRSKVQEALQGSLKYRFMEQTDNDRVPFSMALYMSNVLYPGKNTDGRYDEFVHRLSYVTQAIIARKFSDGLSLEIVPTVIHRNWVLNTQDENTNYAIGFGGRVKLTKRSALVADAFYTFSDFRKANKNIYKMPPVSLGWEVETGGHVFTIMFSNASGLIENDYLVNTTDSWGQGGYKLSFIISRTFTVGGSKW